VKAGFERLALRADERGYVFEPARIAELAAQQNVHVVVSEPGAVRGNHFHKRGSEILTVIGPALVRVREDGVVRDVIVAEGEVMRCDFPPLVAHAIQNTGTRSSVQVAFNTVPHDPAAPDVFPDRLIEPQGHRAG
jgi:UDP-2-acetamido-2,6-beta-L-arabino-hexul-4-ose reductase